MGVSADIWALIGTFAATAFGFAGLMHSSFRQLRTEVSNNHLALGGKIDGVQKDLHQLDKKFDKLEVKFDNLEVKVDNLGVKVDKLDRKVGALEIKVGNISEKVTHLSGMLHGHINGHSHTS